MRKVQLKDCKKLRRKKTQKLTKKERVQKLERNIYVKEIGERQRKTRRIGKTSKRTNV